VDVPRVGPSGGCRRSALRFARHTHERTLDVVELAILKEHAVDIPDDLSGW
jgi:hypothetical protein